MQEQQVGASSRNSKREQQEGEQAVVADRSNRQEQQEEAISKTSIYSRFTEQKLVTGGGSIYRPK